MLEEYIQLTKDYHERLTKAGLPITESEKGFLLGLEVAFELVDSKELREEDFDCLVSGYVSNSTPIDLQENFNTTLDNVIAEDI